MILSENLFGEYFVKREYGNSSYKNATGTIEHQFNSSSEAKAHFESIKAQKIHRGYFQKCA